MGTFGGLAQEMLELGEDLLDRVEVRAVGRQEEEPCAPCTDRCSDRRLLVAGEVVHDDDVAGASVGAPCCSIQAVKLWALIGSSTTNGASIRSERNAARKVMVRQWP